MITIKRKVFHWMWLRRYNKAWKRACRKANWYHEDISHCSPWFYFKDELEELKTL